MSDNASSTPLLAAAPLGLEWVDTARLPLAVLPCLGRLDGSSRTASREEP
jgi:hypothetical protein